MKKNILFLYVILFTLAGCDINKDVDVKKPNFVVSYGTYTDKRDKCQYTTITIGNQTWMAENLRYLPSVNNMYQTSYASARYYVYGYNGTSIKEAMQSTYGYSSDLGEFANMSTFQHFGVLYNYGATLEAIPQGWRLPTSEDYRILRDYVSKVCNGNDYGYATALLDKRCVNMHIYTWDQSDYNALNKSMFFGNSGLDFLPAGYFDATYSSGNFYGIGNSGHYWIASSSSSNGGSGYIDLKDLVKPGYFYPNTDNIYDAYSIRCIMK